MQIKTKIIETVNDFDEFMTSFNIVNKIQKSLIVPFKVFDKPKIKISGNVKEDINRIYGLFISMFPNVNHDIARKNSETLEIKKIKHGLFHKLYAIPVEAYYHIYLNTINVDKFEYNNYFFHELFHAYSSVLEEFVVYSGFSQCDFTTEKDNFNYLCEGYTELLENKLFHSNFSFDVESIFLITDIIGKNRMDKLYFSADTKTLINDLNKYLDYDSVLYYLKLLDVYFMLQIKSNKFNYKKCTAYAQEIKKIIEMFEINLINNYQDVTHKKLLLTHR